MRYRIFTLALLIAPALFTSGCATTGGYGSEDQMSNTVYATHRMVRNLEQNLSGSVTKLNETATALEMRVSETEQSSLQLQAMVEENQVKLDRMQSKLDDFMAAVYRAINVTPPSSGRSDSSTYVPEEEIQITPPRSNSSSLPPTTPIPADESQTVAPEATTVTSVVEGGDAMTDYQNAQKLFVDKNYDAALRAYDNYLQRYPSNSYSANAQFWKAQCLLKMERYQEAVGEYETLRQQFPNSDKVPPAYYYEATALVRLGQTQRAIAALEAVIRQWPATAAATQSEELLTRLQQ